MEQRFHGEDTLRTLYRNRLVHESNYVAEVPVELLETESGWSPYLSLEKA